MIPGPHPRGASLSLYHPLSIKSLSTELLCVQLLSLDLGIYVTYDNIPGNWATVTVSVNLMKKGNSPQNLVPTQTSPVVSGTPTARWDNPPMGLVRVPSPSSFPEDGFTEQLCARNWTASPCEKRPYHLVAPQSWSIITFQNDHLRDERNGSLLLH